ncbi:hypothetical protein IQ274_20355 [Nostoc sp. LEGE 12447]|uniref:hypothetical protein n=1 Tax=Nostoc sp. LEGE 12447 TaxID=1828640 RepID=UPI0018832118|nr:hypothetical protein [Nostoc sp. LEGE 12447]MBE9000527.1 hypothetical protein [Nostoc sp. LEGE 12447]
MVPRQRRETVNPVFPRLVVAKVMGMENGEWGIGNWEWGMGNGEWGMGNGEWLKNQ